MCNIQILDNVLIKIKIKILSKLNEIIQTRNNDDKIWNDLTFYSTKKAHLKLKVHWPLLVPSGFLRIVSSSIEPKGKNMSRKSSSFMVLESIPMNNFLSSEARKIYYLLVFKRLYFEQFLSVYYFAKIPMLSTSRMKLYKLVCLWNHKKISGTMCYFSILSPQKTW